MKREAFNGLIQFLRDHTFDIDHDIEDFALLRPLLKEFKEKGAI